VASIVFYAGCVVAPPPPDPCADVNCDDGDACTTDTCADGVCSNDPVVCSDGESCVEGVCVADEPAGFQAADGINGGQMFDKFWATETGFDQDDANLQTFADNGDFFRCKQCHAWDRLGNMASYIDRGPKTTRPDVTGVNLAAIARDESAQELFDAIKTGDGGTRRPVDADLSTYDPADPATTVEGNQMPNFGEILSDEQIWDLVKYLKDEVLDTTELYDVTTEGTYPTGSRTFSDVGKDGDAAHGDQLYADKCAGCHGADGTTIDLEGRSIGAFAREKPYEMWHKVKFGQLGSAMGPQGVDTLEDMKDLLKAASDPANFPDLGAEPDPCEGVTCDDGSTCVEGACVPDEVGDPVAGEATYMANGCNACHGDDAAGPPSLVGATADTIFDKVSGAESHGGGTFDGITADDAADIVAWVESLP
jgi:mono/diheme cytochrome c family protein